MTKHNKKIASLIAGLGLVVNLATPAFAGTQLVITGNGADSNSNVSFSNTNTTNVVQSNNADIKNNVNVDANTGENDANKNTGGDVHITTGDAEVGVSVENKVNSNVAELNGCGTCNGGDTEVVIEGNGADSENDVTLEQESETSVFQNNYADIYNRINADSDTGDNDAKDNTGGDVHIATGDASTVVAVKNEANGNVASIGGGSDAGSLSAWIKGNGADSDNSIELGLGHALNVVQSNEADIDNKVDVEAETGENDANDNTGGEVSIETGDAELLVGIDNMANFNVADVNCDCFLEDILAKIAGNGADSENEIAAELGDELGIFQSNCSGLPSVGNEVGYYEGEDCEIDNNVDGDVDTGDNEAEDNTGYNGSDPSIETGDAEATVILETEGNVNTVGDSEADIDMGGVGIDLTFNFNLSDLLEMLGL